MAQLLVFTRDNTHSDPAVDQSGCYKTGDVVVVVEDDHQFSDAEKVAPFRVIQVSGSRADYAHLATPDNYKAIPKATLKVPAIRRAALNKTVSDMQRRRRYKYTATIERKPLCQRS